MRAVCVQDKAGAGGASSCRFVHTHAKKYMHTTQQHPPPRHTHPRVLGVLGCVWELEKVA